jgi:hypothetical protein
MFLNPYEHERKSTSGTHLPENMPGEKLWPGARSESVLDYGSREVQTSQVQHRSTYPSEKEKATWTGLAALSWDMVGPIIY